VSYYRRVLKRRPAGLTEAEWLALLSTRFVDRGYFTARDGRDYPPVVVAEVLCCFCRERHSPAEVLSCMVLPRKTAAAGGSPSSTSRRLAAGPLTEYSELWAFLTCPTHPDGVSRLTGSLSLSCDVGMLKLSFQDDETGHYACLTGWDLVEMLTEVELRLGDGSLSWRPSRFAKRKK
jgi:hypothetical protein